MASEDKIDYTGLKTKDYNTLLSDIQATIQNIYAPDGEAINFNSASPDGQITNVLAEISTVLREILTETYNSISPSNCSGAVQDNRYQINYLWRKGGTFTIQNIDITTDRTVTLQGLDANYNDINASSYTVSDNAGNLWFLIDTTTLYAGTTSLPFRAKEIGEVIPQIGTITNQNTIIGGIISVINSVGYTSLGEEQETDEEFRIRRERSVALASQNNIDSIIGDLLQLDGVTDVNLWINTTNSIDDTGTPAHTLWTIVNGGSNADIADVIYSNIGGSDTRGNVSVNIDTLSHQTLTINFDRPTVVPIYVRFNIKVTGDKDKININGLKEEFVQQSSYKIGEDISSGELTANAMNALELNGGANIAYVTDLEIWDGSYIQIEGDWDTPITVGSNTWNGITYGNNKFVVVGDSGYISTSTDGTTWTTPTQVGSNNWYGITYGNNKFVAVDTSSHITTSTDGTTWTTPTTVGSSSWYGITYTNNKFIAVGFDGSGSITTSEDGTTWTTPTTVGSNTWYDVTYGNNKFVVVGASGYISTSTDGTTWTTPTTVGSNTWRGITYANNKFVAVGANGYISTSTDGTTWTTPTTVGSNTWRDITYANNKFVVVGDSGYISTSEDGTTWTTPTAVGSGTWYGITYGNNKFVAVGNSGYIVYTVSQENWTNLIQANTQADLFTLDTSRVTTTIIEV